MQHYIHLALCGRLRWLHKRALRGVPSTFWVVLVDGRGVSGCAVHVLGGFCGREWCFRVCRPRFGWFLWTGVAFRDVSSTFWVVFVAGSGVSGGAVHVLGGFCGREWCFRVCRPRFGWFLWTGVVFPGVPSTFWVVFVDGSSFSADFFASRHTTKKEFISELLSCSPRETVPR
jgi:hypothetical protein